MKKTLSFGAISLTVFMTLLAVNQPPLFLEAKEPTYIVAKTIPKVELYTTNKRLLDTVANMVLLIDTETIHGEIGVQTVEKQQQVLTTNNVR